MFRTPLTPPQRISRATRGFTLVELLVVMAIILILAGIVVGVQRGVYQKQSLARANADLSALATALESYKLKYGDYPWLADDTDGEELFLHLTGKKKMTAVKSGSPQFEGTDDPKANPKYQPFISDESMQLNANNDAFVDPWGNEYQYYYRASASGTWNYPGFILISTGPDGSTASSSDLKKGTIKADYHGDDPANKSFDDIIYGFEF